MVVAEVLMKGARAGRATPKFSATTINQWHGPALESAESIKVAALRLPLGALAFRRRAAQLSLAVHFDSTRAIELLEMIPI